MLERKDMRDLALLGALATALGFANVAIRGDDLPLVASEPDPVQAVCGAGADEVFAVPRISVTEAVELLGRKDVTFVDARSADEYASAHVPSAITLPAIDAEGVLDTQSVPIPPENLIITYCDGLTCEQSEYLGLLLKDRTACEQVNVLEGGWNAWVEAGAPIITGVEDRG
jgi:rhodanese-related sulfurtransferase